MENSKVDNCSFDKGVCSQLVLGKLNIRAFFSRLIFYIQYRWAKIVGVRFNYVLGVCGASFLFCFPSFASVKEESSAKVYHSQASPLEKRLSGNYSLGIEFLSSSETEEDEVVESDRRKLTSEFKLKSNLNYKLSENFFFTSNLKLRARQGHAQLWYDHEYSDSMIKFYEAVFGYSMNEEKNVLFKAGLIRQDFISDFSLFYRNAFLGFYEEFNLKNQWAHVYLKAQQSIPESISSNDERQGVEKTPYFLSGALGVESWIFDKVKLEGRLSYYRYIDLPSVIARDSHFNGNSVIGQENNSKFRYEFEGYVARLNINPLYGVKNWDLNLGGEWAENIKAEQDGRAQFINGRLSWKINDVFWLDYSYLRFFKEREILPAKYTSLSMGGTNRVGDSHMIEVTFPQFYFSLEGKFYFVDTIEKDLNQGQRAVTSLSINTTYMEF